MGTINVKRFLSLKVFCSGGYYFRLITEPLTADEIGQNIVVFFRPRILAPGKFFIGKFGGFEEDSNGKVLILRPDIINCEYLPGDFVIGWIFLSCFYRDLNDSRLQSNPESFESVITHPIK